ncbi:CapA family protein [Geodermatophilus amargosae]|uniref:CapA family protein n=1 Tax=Geodermatophilus amargosae TaxID=1296565 RepID=UPI0015872313|nr:CapA family protein [Geodermatophilus amargosae]
MQTRLVRAPTCSTIPGMRRAGCSPRHADPATKAARRPSPHAARSASTKLLWPLLTVVITLLITACSPGGPAVTSAGQGSTASTSTGASADQATPSAGAREPEDQPTSVEVSAVGDVIMGATLELPPDNGRHLFDAVADRLTGDVVLGNLDQALTDIATSTKCGANSSGCFAFRTPPSYAGWLREAGFTVINLANNHAHDFGDAGLRDSQAALTAAGLQYTGMPGQVTLQDIGSLRVAILGFAPYGWAQSLLDIPAAQQLVGQAAEQADVVLVSIHAGAEGADQAHVRPGPEIFLGENRGDAMAFARAVIDAGADAVLGAGPHVLRGMEWYRGRLIAYSMGNFTGYRTLSNDGPAGIGGIVTLRLAADGTWHSGQLVSTVMVDPGLAQLDPAQQALGVVRDLSRADFGACGVDLTTTGELSAPTC